MVGGHNIINYDLVAFKMYFGIPFEIERDMSVGSPLGDDTWGGTQIRFDDTLVRAKTLNPDRFGGNSLEALAEKGAIQKIAFRKHLPQSQRFKHFAPDMLYYNIFDVRANRVVAKLLDAEMAEFDWNDKWHPAIKLEKAVMDLITRQAHRGFKFDKELAEANLAELDQMMEERRVKIEAIIPPRPATQKVMNDSSPPKKQFKQNGEPTAHMIKFAEKMGAEIVDDNFVYQGVKYPLPLEDKPLITEIPATVNDTTHIKDWLVGLGWVPLEYKEKDITVDTKKIKLPQDKLEKAIERYIEQTINTSFMYDRVEHLMMAKDKMPARSRLRAPQAERLIRMEFARRAERKGGIKVLTNPSFTVGQEKEICGNLLAFIEQNPEYTHIKDIVEYLTYRHRRNSILGGGMSFEDFDNDDDEQTAKGFLANVREDGRIATPADTCGAATSRMKHRLVANIPRVTTLYGAMMRALFGVDDTCYQIGYDFDSLEAREEAHFCWDFEDGDVKEYCQSLLMDKPFDVHTMMAQKISAIIARDFARGPAKSVKYGCTYGAQAAKVAKTLGSDLATGTVVFDAFWEAASPLKGLKIALQSEWAQFGKRKIVGIDGRLVPTRSAHAILNSKFQSSGVICAKRAMVLHDRKLKEAGLLVDFLVDSLDNREWCQQLIAYHDEAQLEASKKSVKFKRFATKDEAQAFKDAQHVATGEIWSDIKDSPKGGVFVGYCKAGHLAVDAVSEVGKDFGMKVDLTAGYMIGNNWKECH
ncbi:DNA polymerase I [compost metagenome]